MRQKNALWPSYEVAFLRSILTAVATDPLPAHGRALVDVQLLELKARDQRRPSPDRFTWWPAAEACGRRGRAPDAHQALHGPSLPFLPVMAACPPASQVPPRLRSSLTALLLMHYGQRRKTSPGAVFEAVL